jgi:chromosome segregation ATPase
MNDEKPSWEWQQEVEALTARVEAQAWTVSPAMAAEQIHQLNLKIIHLEEWVSIGNATRDALRQQLADVHAHLEVQRQATYQAVEREHAAKQQLAEVTQERDNLRLRIKAVDQEHGHLKAEREKMVQAYATLVDAKLDAKIRA